MKKCYVWSALLVTVCVVTASWQPISAADNPEQCLLTVKTYIFSASTGTSGLSFPLFPHMSLAVLEETISDVETYFAKLKSLYAFSDYRLLEAASVQVRLGGHPRPQVGAIKYESPDKAGSWKVTHENFSWDKEGRLQMLVKISHKDEPFLESHISVLPERSVVLGRFADEKMNKAIFAVIVPIVEVAALAKNASERGNYVGLEDQEELVRKTGLPLPEPKRKKSAYGCPDNDKDVDPAHPSPAEFQNISKMPVAIETHHPEYPESARQAGIEGKVWLRSLISTDGSVLKCCVVRSSGRDDFDRAAVEAAQENRYNPGLDEDGNPMEVWIMFRVVFVLD